MVHIPGPRHCNHNGYQNAIGPDPSAWDKAQLRSSETLSSPKEICHEITLESSIAAAHKFFLFPHIHTSHPHLISTPHIPEHFPDSLVTLPSLQVCLVACPRPEGKPPIRRDRHGLAAKEQYSHS